VAAAVVDAAAAAAEEAEAAAAAAAAALLSPPPHAIRLSFGGRPDPARSQESQASARSSAQGSAPCSAQDSADGSAHGSAQSSNSSSRDRGSGGSSLGASGSRGSSRSNSTCADGPAADHLPDTLRRSLQLPHMPNTHQLSRDGLGTDKENPTRMATGKVSAPTSARETVRDTARELSRAQYNLRPKTARPLGGVAADSLAAAQQAPKRRPESARPAPSSIRTTQPAPSTVAATGGARWR